MSCQCEQCRTVSVGRESLWAATLAWERSTSISTTTSDSAVWWKISTQCLVNFLCRAVLGRFLCQSEVTRNSFECYPAERFYRRVLAVFFCVFWRRKLLGLVAGHHVIWSQNSPGMCTLVLPVGGRCVRTPVLLQAQQMSKSVSKRVLVTPMRCPKWVLTVSITSFRLNLCCAMATVIGQMSGPEGDGPTDTSLPPETCLSQLAEGQVSRTQNLAGSCPPPPGATHLRRTCVQISTFRCSVWISYTHNQDPSKAADQKSPISIVTANVDRIGENTQIVVEKPWNWLSFVWWKERAFIHWKKNLDFCGSSQMLSNLDVRNKSFLLMKFSGQSLVSPMLLNGWDTGVPPPPTHTHTWCSLQPSTAEILIPASYGLSQTNRNTLQWRQHSGLIAVHNPFVADFKEKVVRPDQDIDIKGHVSWVGSTSLEVSMRVEQVSPVVLTRCSDLQKRCEQNWLQRCTPVNVNMLNCLPNSPAHLLSDNDNISHLSDPEHEREDGSQISDGGKRPDRISVRYQPAIVLSPNFRQDSVVTFQYETFAL